MVIKTIAPQHNADCDAEPISPLELYYEGISALKKKQLPCIRYAWTRDCSLFTAHIIKQHMTFTMSETEDDDSDGGHGLISCDPPSFPVIFFITLPFERLKKL